MNLKPIFAFLIILCSFAASHAQIGYQVALFNQQSGEPRANETVAVTVTVTDNAGTVICAETKTVTTNGAGIASLEVGNASTFDSADWNRLPLWVAAKVDGVTLARTQILSVPVAEHARHYGELTPEILASKRWSSTGYGYYTFSASGRSATFIQPPGAPGDSGTNITYSYEIIGNTVILTETEESQDGQALIYVPGRNALYQYDECRFYD